MATAASATLTLPALDVGAGGRLRCALWWDTEPQADALFLESSADGGETWRAVPFTTVRDGEAPAGHPAGSVTGWSGRVWHRVAADLPATARLVLRWRYTTDRLYAGRGAYVDALRVGDAGSVLFDEARPADSARIEAVGWAASSD
jgi:hypothetical protein